MALLEVQGYLDESFLQSFSSTSSKPCLKNENLIYQLVACRISKSSMMMTDDDEEEEDETGTLLSQNIPQGRN